MAVSNYFQLQAFPQGEDLSKAHGIFVKLNSSGAIVKTQAATDAVVGVVIISLPYDSTDSKNCPGVCCERGVKVPAVASGAISVGDMVALAANGRIAKATSGTLIGVATEAAAVAGGVITILVTGSFTKAAA